MKNMENKQQTAVEWLKSSFYSYAEPSGDYVINRWTIDEEDLVKVIEKAKEMERQQIVDAHDCGYIDGANKKNDTAEQYYNETYGGNK